MEVAFDRRGLRPLTAVAAPPTTSSAAMAVEGDELLGVPLPPALRVLTGLLAVALGLLGFAAVVARSRSSDPAVRVVGDRLLLHVNPGRRVELGRHEVRSVGPVRPVPSAVQRLVLGDRVFEIATTRPEGVRASSVLVGSRFVVGDLAAVREGLAAVLER